MTVIELQALLFPILGAALVGTTAWLCAVSAVKRYKRLSQHHADDPGPAGARSGVARLPVDAQVHQKPGHGSASVSS
jgi:hypothetical protein